MELNVASLETYQWIELKVYKRKMVCLVIMFTPISMIFKITEIADFFVFSADNSKTFVTVGEIYLSTQRRY